MGNEEKSPLLLEHFCLSRKQRPNTQWRGADWPRSRSRRRGPNFPRSNRPSTNRLVEIVQETTCGNLDGHLRNYTRERERERERERGEGEQTEAMAQLFTSEKMAEKRSEGNSTLGWIDGTDRHGWLTEHADSVITCFIASHVNGEWNLGLNGMLQIQK